MTRRLVVLAEGQFDFHYGKTAMGVIRYGPDRVVAVLDSTNAGLAAGRQAVSRAIPSDAVPAASETAPA